MTSAIELVAGARKWRSVPFRTLFPEEGSRARRLYSKHMEFFTAGAEFKERLFMAGNRVGKTISGAFETTAHLTGRYPEWWQGKRFDKATDGWACAVDGNTNYEIVQRVLLGKTPEDGMIPFDLIIDKTAARGGKAGSIDSVWVKHVSGKASVLVFKAYEQGRRSFEGAAKDFIWDDEEPPADIYSEQMYRLLTTKGIIYTTFTPLLGRSEVVNAFLEPSPESKKLKWYVQAGWRDVPHLDEEEKKHLAATTNPAELQARMNGEPRLGVGTVYPIPEEEIIIDTKPIPDSWRRVFAMDVGWNRTAVLWGAQDPGNGRIVLYDEHYQGFGEPASHASAIRSRGTWVRGVIDPAARGRSQVDGRQLLQMYVDLGLTLTPAINAVDAGITEVWQALVSGQLKVQRHLENLLREFRKYHRDEKGHVVKEADHLMDAMRYLWMSGREILTLNPNRERHESPESYDGRMF
jgi:phage terminase large subunit-like protein